MTRAIAAVALGALFTIVAGCSYSPHFVSGLTQCADSSPLCPSGFVCDTAAGVCVSSSGGSDAATDTAADTATGDVPADRAADTVADTGGTSDAPADTGAGDTHAGDGAIDAGCTADIVTSTDNCGACGHSCGGGLCDRGVCQAMTLPGINAATSISVDATQIYFTSSTKILACPKSGCVLQPTQIDDMGNTGYSTWAVNVTNGNLFFMSAPTQQGTEHDDLFECPLAGCPAPAPIIGAAMPYNVNYLTNAGNDVYWSDDQARKTFRRACLPNDGACDTMVAVLDESIGRNLLAGSGGTELYFVDAAGLQKCPYAGCPGTPPVPAPTLLTSTVPTGVVNYGGLLYLQFGDEMHTLNGAIRTCNPVDCDAQTPKSFIANRDPITALTVDAQGVYWIEDATIYSCPRTGCVGGPRTLASGLVPITTLGFNAHPIVTDDAFVYWIQDTSGAVMRIAK